MSKSTELSGPRRGTRGLGQQAHGSTAKRVAMGLAALVSMLMVAGPAQASGFSAQTRAASQAPAVQAATPAAQPAAAATGQMTGFDAQMITLVNTARVAAGAGRLTEARGLTQLAVWWSTQMDNGATSYDLQHNPNAWTMVTAYGAANRTTWGENVAWSSSTTISAQAVFTAYMNSPGHRANILSRSYKYIGMGTMSGPHGLFNTTEFTDAVQPGQAITDFVLDTSTTAVYRLVGGAPVYVSSWAIYGGVQPAKLITHAQLLAMPQYPANGTFIVTPGSGAVYRIVGGAPVYVSSWTPFGGGKPAVPVDPQALAKAGSGGYYDHLRLTPANGTYVVTPGSGAVYRFAGGAPIYVASWAPMGGVQASVAVDPAAIANAGGAGWWTHVKMYPVTPSYIQGAGFPKVYQVINGVPTWLTSWALAGGPKAVTVVHPLAISRAGTGGYYNHLR